MVSVSPSAASGAQIAALAGSASTAAYESALSSDAPPTENWEMADSGTQAYTGAVAVSGGGTTLPCQRVEATVQEAEAGTTSCVLPAGPGLVPRTFSDHPPLVAGQHGAHDRARRRPRPCRSPSRWH